jgi:hypothetical protein
MFETALLVASLVALFAPLCEGDFTTTVCRHFTANIVMRLRFRFGAVDFPPFMISTVEMNHRKITVGRVGAPLVPST